MLMGLVSQLPSLTSHSQQDGPGDVGAEDSRARGSDSLHHSPTPWQLGTETVLPQRHDVPYWRASQHGLVRMPARTWVFLGNEGLCKEKIEKKRTRTLSSAVMALADCGGGMPFPTCFVEVTYNVLSTALEKYFL